MSQTLTQEHQDKHNIKTEALRCLIHGLPGTEKSDVIKWITRMLQEARGYTNGIEVICVAFQNRVAHKMNGSTLHQAGEVAVAGGNNNERKLQHNDVDQLFTKKKTKHKSKWPQKQ